MSKTVTDITKQAAILEFIKWFTQTGTVAAKWAEAGHISSCISATESSEYKNNAYATNFFANFYPDINNFQNLPVVKDAKTYVDNIVRLFSSTVLVEKGYTDNSDLNAMRIAQDDINNSLDWFN